MNPISIFCPVTNRSVGTGIETDWSTFFALQPLRLRVRCPDCGGRHDVAVGDGYLARSESGADGGRPDDNPRIESLLARLPEN
ncbi:MAG: hypothetical protein AB7V13_01680 [Pseudorhodoplanes sp.]|uniref:hypothetical protein n=1 Tax=Pseudorhodoplanes sp. TaxID=1934341 RepID=UPI003D1521F3